MIDALASLFGAVVRLIYNLVGENYGLSIIIFAVLTKVLLFPLNLKQAKTMENMKKVGPMEQEIRKKYKGNNEKIATELQKVYAENKINPLAGCLPALIQIPIVIAMFYIVKQPLTSSALKGVTSIRPGISVSPILNPSAIAGPTQLCEI